MRGIRGALHIGWMAALWLAVMSVSAVAADMTSAPRWVKGSWVNVRQSTAEDSPVTDHLTANTEVGLLSVDKKSCLVTWGKSQERRGFVACRFLGETPLNFERISTRWWGGGENTEYSPAKAFWMKPSLSRLLDAGEGFHGRFLSPVEAKIREGGFTDEVPKLIRYPVPEFEAMKALLGQGIVPDEEQKPEMVPLSILLKRISRPESDETPLSDMKIYTDGLVFAQLKTIKIPPARPSLFKRLTDFAPPGASVESIAAQFHLREKASFRGGVHWLCSRVQDGCFFSGIWDVGGYTVALEQPVYLHAVDRRGLMSVMEYPGVSQYNFTESDYEETCRDDLLQGGLADIYGHGTREGHVLPGYPRVKSPLFWFFTPTPLGIKSVRLNSYKVKASASRQSDSHDIAVYEVDVDADKRPDFVLLRGALGGVSVMDGWFHLVLVNVNGEWLLASSGEDVDCT